MNVTCAISSFAAEPLRVEHIPYGKQLIACYIIDGPQFVEYWFLEPVSLPGFGGLCYVRVNMSPFINGDDQCQIHGITESETDPETILQFLQNARHITNSARHDSR